MDRVNAVRVQGRVAKQFMLVLRRVGIRKIVASKMTMNYKAIYVRYTD